MFGLRKRRKWGRPTVSDIEEVVSELADRYGYGDIWLYGNYYENLFEPGDPAQIMLDRTQEYPHVNGFMDECYQALGVDVHVYYTRDDRRTDYIRANSRLIHHA